VLRVHRKRRLLESVLLAYREGDLHECIQRVRTLVEAAPDVTAARYLLASLYAHTDNGRLALVHYRKLLEPFVARGDLFRAIAIQKRIESFEKAPAPNPDRWVALQTQLRAHGVPYLVAVPGGSGRPWIEAQFLALPRVWFVRVAEETRVELIEAGVADIEGGTVWEVLAGRLRWSFALPDGRASSEVIAAEGDAITIDPDLARRAQVTFVPELPVESLRFDPGLARELRGTFASLAPLTAATAGGFTTEVRALLPSRPRPQADLDVSPPPPASATGSEPRRLLPPGTGSASGTDRDTGEWVEFGVVALTGAAGEAPHVPGSEPGADAGPAPEAGESRERTVELPPHGAEAQTKRGRPRVERPGPVEMGDGLIVPPIADPFAAPIQDLGEPIERRRGSRVAVSFQSRMALLGLKGSRLAPVHGQLTDLSPSGLGMRFPKQALWRARTALADAVVAVELDVPEHGEPLRVAAQVRWIEIDDHADEARLGLEFVLMTEPDRRRIAGALAAAPLPTLSEATDESG
jgi:hypothetical protein